MSEIAHIDRHQDPQAPFFLGDAPEASKAAARFLKTLANGDRLTVLCALVDCERPVSDLESSLGLSQSSVSQHLGRLRAEGLVAARRDGRNIFYSLSDARVEELLKVLYPMFCRAG